MPEKRRHTRTFTLADKAARDRLQAIWDRKAEALGVNQQTVADLMERSQGLVSQYQIGRLALNYRAVMAFAKALEVDPTEIRSDLPELQPLIEGPALIEQSSWLDVLVYDQGVAAGDGMVPDDYAETDRLKFKRSSLQRKGLASRKLEVFYARGDSMEPRIHDGDALLIDRTDTNPVDGVIYMVSYNGELYVKRLHQYGNQWFLVSDNGSDPKWRKPRPVDIGSTLEIIGRVRWIGSWED